MKATECLIHATAPPLCYAIQPLLKAHQNQLVALSNCLHSHRETFRFMMAMMMDNEGRERVEAMIENEEMFSRYDLLYSSCFFLGYEPKGKMEKRSDRRKGKTVMCIECEGLNGHWARLSKKKK